MWYRTICRIILSDLPSWAIQHMVLHRLICRFVSSWLLRSAVSYTMSLLGNHQWGFRHNRSATVHIRVFLHSSDAGEKMGMQRDSTSAIRRLQESL
jgi:hypothetical protein